MSLRERIGALFRLFLLFTVLVAVALISAVTTIRLTIQGHQVTMPNLAGVSLETAQRLASGLGLELKIEDKVFSTQYPARQIVSQVPPPGTRIKMGQHVHVLVSLGPPRVVVPDVVGDSLRAAQITAIQRGLTVGNVAAIHWPGTERDTVVAQDPPAMTSDVHSPAVNFLISLGEIPAAFVCPSFVGRPLVEARRALQKAGFREPESIPISTDATTPKGIILTQSPPPGSKIPADTTFTFQVTQ